MSALAEMERELIVERTLAGLAAARAQGRLGGRPRAINKHEQEQISRLLEKGHPRQQLAIILYWRIYLNTDISGQAHKKTNELK
ncbi:DNA-invertase [Salmonella enterica subsp. enterica]|uniref:DNA-invertase n=1 Tax=Salmonella enterica I TaxID=59201 RepID=A0A379VLU1_SALET|nr:DNA-invertase [Salmonella enterica subsp. enterica]